MIAQDDTLLLSDTTIAQMNSLGQQGESLCLIQQNNSQSVALIVLLQRAAVVVWNSALPCQLMRMVLGLTRKTMEIPDNYPEKYWHCHIEIDTGGKKRTSAIFNDLTIEELWQQVVNPWHSHRPFTVDGTIVRDFDKVQKIKITQTEYPQSYYADQHNVKMRSRGIADMATNRRLLPLSNGEDHTHEFLFSESPEQLADTKEEVSNNKIFIVHGHDEQVKESTARFVEKLGLEAVILHEQANEGKTIIEKLEKHTDVGYSLVLLTPDDVGASAGDEVNLRPRARQNVLLELGYMAAKLGRGKVCALKKGDIELPSDFLGVLYVEIDTAGAWRLQVAKELKVAGLSVDLNNAI